MLSLKKEKRKTIFFPKAKEKQMRETREKGEEETTPRTPCSIMGKLREREGKKKKETTHRQRKKTEKRKRKREKNHTQSLNLFCCLFFQPPPAAMARIIAAI
jgi:hypothetical protein